MLCENPYFAFINLQNKLEFISLKDKERVRDDEYTYMDWYSSYCNQPPLRTVKVIKVPCGTCIMCRIEKTSEWAARCWLEAKRYDNNQFVTLTYSPENEPEFGVERAEVSRFMHNLREHFRRKYKHTGIRFFASAEYGTGLSRPHYHIILFNCPPFGDEKLYKVNDIGQPLYTSKILEKLWGKGFCAIGAVTRKSTAYVARYSLKKLYFKAPKDENDEFICMSNRKGIGYDYLVENIDQIIKEDKVRLTGDIFIKLPRYYDRKIKEIIGKERYMTEIAQPRIERAKLYLENEALKTGLTTKQLHEQYIATIKCQILKFEKSFELDNTNDKSEVNDD
jgi:hypothetical protein